MPAKKNVLLIVVDQWRGLMLPKLGADYLKLPNIDRLSVLERANRVEALHDVAQYEEAWIAGRGLARIGRGRGVADQSRI